MAADVERGMSVGGAPAASARTAQSNQRARRLPARERDRAVGELGTGARSADAAGRVDARRWGMG